MPVKVKNLNHSQLDIQFISKEKHRANITHLQKKDVQFYKKCFYGSLSIEIGNYVFVSNADSPDPDTLDGCDIGRILFLYELTDQDSVKDPCRAIVQWYSRPKDIPHKFYDNDKIAINFDKEIIEEYRPYDNDISIETILRKCNVILGNETSSIKELIMNNKKTSSTMKTPTFVCRYKFIKIKNVYKLISLDENGNEIISKEKKWIEPEENTSKNLRKSVSTKKKGLEFVDVNDFGTVATPLRLSNAENSPAKLTRTPNDKLKTARRNLNITLDSANSTADSDILNYSIIQGTSNQNEMKIKLRLSSNQSDTKRTLSEITPESKENFNVRRKRSISIDEGSSLLKKTLQTFTPSSKTYENTPRRRSILKTPGSLKSNSGTPRRSILLSNIVEERFIQENSVVSTPKALNNSTKLSERDIEKLINDSSEDDNSDQISDIKRSRRQSVSTFDNYPITPTKAEIYSGTPKKNRRIDIAHRKKLSDTEVDTAKRTEIVVNSANKQDVQNGQITPRRKSATRQNEPFTPSQKRKLIKDGTITPTMRKRSQSISCTSKSNLQIVREKLHVSAVPDNLPCRENEFENIFTFVRDKILDKSGGSMYVSGVPGTGKTATITRVIKRLRQMSEEEELPEFDFIEVNGMRLTEPRQAYVQINKQLTGKTLSWEQSLSSLEKRFSRPAPRRTTTVILVDELDILCNRRQDVVYNLLDWPSKSAAKLVVITIANTMDLPERLLMSKVTSRLGLTRLTFKPYTFKQLQEIVVSRLCGLEAFKSDAVQFVARKVAAISGDARRALDICRRATEIANENDKEIVDMQHVNRALQEMIASTKVQAIKKCSRLEQIFLQAVAAEVTRTGIEETLFDGAYSQMISISSFLGLPPPPPGKAMKICSKLGSQRLLICEHSRQDIFQKIFLNVSTDDIHYALEVNIE